MPSCTESPTHRANWGLLRNLWPSGLEQYKNKIVYPDIVQNCLSVQNDHLHRYERKSNVLLILMIKYMHFGTNFKFFTQFDKSFSRNFVLSISFKNKTLVKIHIYLLTSYSSQLFHLFQFVAKNTISCLLWKNHEAINLKLLSHLVTSEIVCAAISMKIITLYLTLMHSYLFNILDSCDWIYLKKRIE